MKLDTLNKKKKKQGEGCYQGFESIRLLVPEISNKKPFGELLPKRKVATL